MTVLGRATGQGSTADEWSARPGARSTRSSTRSQRKPLTYYYELGPDLLHGHLKDRCSGGSTACSACTNVADKSETATRRLSAARAAGRCSRPTLT